MHGRNLFLNYWNYLKIVTPFNVNTSKLVVIIILILDLSVFESVEAIQPALKVYFSLHRWTCTLHQAASKPV